MPLTPEEIAAVAAAVVAAQRVTDGGPTVSRVLALYSESPTATELRAWNSERGRIKHLVRILGARSASTLTLADVDDYRRARAEAAPGTRNRELVRLTAALRWATDRGHLARFPLPRLRLEHETEGRSTYRSEDDVRLIVTALRARGRHAIAALVATAFDGMLRRQEATRLRMSQLSHRDGTIALYAAETKAKRDRVTLLSAWAADMIDQVERPRGCPWVFPSSTGRPYNARTVLRYYQQACEDAGLEAAPGERNWLHDMRAGGADQQVAAGTPIPDVMKLAGWKDYRTARRYLRRPARAVAIEAAARLEAKRRPPKSAPMDPTSDKASDDSQKTAQN